MQKTIKIEGMSCRHCENHVKKELEAVCGVTSANVSADKGTAVVELAHEVDEVKFKAAVEEAGYEFVEVK
ncbi:heavy-metal-associated domain-containing protein [Iocasia frigidifontis]|uniref:Heavy-metal-associated domain-containing protein n=1 Tax=Iocasia fonsfrigidae TaxID=2682810 RepID=A0A8A7KBF3_9FIRM|nr:cation transporter [Iocasia fonsfrigidae]QTL97425.1 heavy-metal-associated domain-containing protein [Iocasia fonsfrigidae]